MTVHPEAMKTKELYLNEKQVAEMIGLSVITLRNRRCQRRGFPYVKIGKSVRYLRQTVLDYMAERTIQVEPQ
jgi:predicted DNA-binding transcriptional regulator AlpA